MDSAVPSTETRPVAACRSVTTFTEGQQQGDADWFIMSVVVGEFCSFVLNNYFECLLCRLLVLKSATRPAAH